MKASLVLLLSLCFIPSLLFAQQGEGNDSTYGWGWGWNMGPYLPNQIPNVTEIQPTVGLRLSFPSSAKSATEYALTSSNANNVSLLNFSISSKGEFEYNGVYNHVYVGLDALSYRLGNADFKTQAGLHFGVGFSSHLGGNSHFRMDMKLTATNPGTSLYVGIGFETRYPVSEAAAGEGQ